MAGTRPDRQTGPRRQGRRGGQAPSSITTSPGLTLTVECRGGLAPSSITTTPDLTLTVEGVWLLLALSLLLLLLLSVLSNLDEGEHVCKHE